MSVSKGSSWSRFRCFCWDFCSVAWFRSFQRFCGKKCLVCTKGTQSSPNVTTSAQISNNAFIDVLVRLSHSKYRIVLWCTSSIIHLSNSRLACLVSNVTLNNVFKLKFVWCFAVFNATLTPNFVKSFVFLFPAQTNNPLNSS